MGSEMCIRDSVHDEEVRVLWTDSCLLGKYSVVGTWTALLLLHLFLLLFYLYFLFDCIVVQLMESFFWRFASKGWNGMKSSSSLLPACGGDDSLFRFRFELGTASSCSGLESSGRVSVDLVTVLLVKASSVPFLAGADSLWRVTDERPPS